MTENQSEEICLDLKIYNFIFTVPMTEEELYQPMLINRLKKGDNEAFADIYRLYSRKLYLKVFKMVKDKDITDEIIQELFIKIWEQRQRIDETKSFQSYLYTIAQNMVYDHFRKQASENKLLEALVNNIAAVNTGQTAIEDKEVAELIRQAVDQLSPQRKMAFTLCKIEGKSYKEVSEIMGVSPATINTHITQSMQHIRTYMIRHRGIYIITVTMSATLYHIL